MSWPLELLEHIFRFVFESAREAAARDESRPRWLRDSLVISYYVLAALILFSAFLSWKVAVIVAIVFIASLIVGAITETDDPGFL